MIHWHRTATGWTWRDTGVAGSLPRSSSMRDGNRILIAATGFIRIVDGTGLRIIRGAGRRFIMADGFIMDTLAGAGLPATFGGLRGYPGAITIIIAAGHHCLQGRILLPESASRSVDTASA